MCTGKLIHYDAFPTHRVLPRPGRHKFYFDRGTEGMDAGYGDCQQAVDRVMDAAGYIPGKDWVTHVFEGHTHSESDWGRRVEIPLGFLLGER